MERKVIQVEERPPLLLNIPLSIQHLFAMFGATVLVPFLFNVNPTTCLFMNGIGTLLYLFLTKGKIPSYLGSSFAFISPVMVILSTSSYSDAQSGFIVFGLIFILFSLIIKYTGTGWIDIIFPPNEDLLPTTARHLPSFLTKRRSFIQIVIGLPLASL